MSGRLADTTLVTALAVMVTVCLAWPVLRAPSERLFGAETVGRHHDPFTVMRQFDGPAGSASYAQPLTDAPGRLLARVVDGVAAYNLVVLASFPLAAAAAHLLARHLGLSAAAAAAAALAFAFSPFHLAQAAYHPHIAQVQWLPLYFLALWRCLDSATTSAVAVLGAATVAVTLSNFYGGLIAAGLTPVAAAAYWLTSRQRGERPLSHLRVTVASLLTLAVAGAGYIWWTGGFATHSEPAFPRLDLVRYGATWQSYVMPPVEHPVLGVASARYWAAAGVGDGLLEQQLSLGWSVMVLALIGVGSWFVSHQPSPPLARVPTLVAVAVAAVLWSLAPAQGSEAIAAFQPSVLLHSVLPMFRSYARFGSMVQLMAVLLAGIGLEALLRAGPRRARVAGGLLVALAAAEYAVLPSALSRDVLPTAAHRWVMTQAAPIRVMDCVKPTAESESVQWLSNERTSPLSVTVSDCNEPNLSQKLVANGYTHLLVRRDPSRPGPAGWRVPLTGMTVAASFDDGRVYRVTSPAPAIYTGLIRGFAPRESDTAWSWRWFGANPSWLVENTTAGPLLARLTLEAASFHRDRSVTIFLNGRVLQTLLVSPERRPYVTHPFLVPAGAHELTFHAGEAPTVADEVLHNHDRRPLSIAVGTWAWTVADRPQP